MTNEEKIWLYYHLFLCLYASDDHAETRKYQSRIQCHLNTKSIKMSRILRFNLRACSIGAAVIVFSPTTTAPIGSELPPSCLGSVAAVELSCTLALTGGRWFSSFLANRMVLMVVGIGISCDCVSSMAVLSRGYGWYTRKEYKNYWTNVLQDHYHWLVVPFMFWSIISSIGSTKTDWNSVFMNEKPSFSVSHDCFLDHFDSNQSP